MLDDDKVFFDNIFFQELKYEDWLLFKKLITTKHYKKNQMILAMGSRCKNFYMIKSGAVRVSCFLNNEERTTHFFVENGSFIDFESITLNAPSEFNFIAEEDCVMYEVNYRRLIDEVFSKSHYLERIARLMLEITVAREINLRRVLLSCEAVERYDYLIENNPYIFRRFQLKHIASFIGITPVSLSRLRKTKYELQDSVK